MTACRFFLTIIISSCLSSFYTKNFLFITLFTSLFLKSSSNLTYTIHMCMCSNIPKPLEKLQEKCFVFIYILTHLKATSLLEIYHCYVVQCSSILSLSYATCHPLSSSITTFLCNGICYTSFEVCILERG